MAAWIWILIPLVVIIGGFIMEYQKNKLSMLNRSRQNEEEVEDLRQLMNSFKTRIENLEAIAAGEPNEFKTGAGTGMKEVDIDKESSAKEENRQHVSNIVNKRREKQ